MTFAALNEKLVAAMAMLVGRISIFAISMA